MSMTKISVKNVVNSGKKASNAKTIIVNCKSGIKTTGNQLESRIKNSNNISGRINSSYSKLSDIESRIAKLKSVCDTTATNYQNTDNRIKNSNLKQLSGSIAGKSSSKNNNSKSDFKTKWEIKLLNSVKKAEKQYREYGLSLISIKNGNNIFNVIGYDASRKGLIFGETSKIGYIFKDIINSKDEKIKTEYLGKISSVLSLGLTSGFKFKELEDTLEDFFEDKGLRKETHKPGMPKYKNIKDGKEISEKDAPDYYDEKAKLLEFEVEKSGSVSLYEKEVKLGENGSASLAVSKAEAHGSIAGGLYVIGNDGEKKFSPGVSAEIGASYTVLEGEIEGQWGNDLASLNAGAKGTVGKVEASAEGNVQFYGKDGKFKPQVNAKVSAEAIAVEGEIDIGGKILGGGVTGKIKGNVGAGAHAEIGIKDGVIKCDVAASVGLGVGLEVEIDVGGMVNTVADYASSAWNGIKGLFK